MNKRGVSSIIITVLLVIVTLATISILWFVVSSFLESSTKNISFAENLIGLDIIEQSAIYYEADDSISFRVNRDSYSGNLSGLRVVVEGQDGNSKAYDLLVYLDSLETKTFYFSLDGLVSNPVKISVLPMFSKDGKTSIGSVKDSENLIISSSEPNIPQCSDGLDNDNDGSTDLADPGCSDANDNDETDLPPPTSNLMFDIGANLEGPDDWQRMNMFVDAIKSARYKKDGSFQTASYTTDGWPIGDFNILVFTHNNRHCEDQIPNDNNICDTIIKDSDDIDRSGTYHLSFKGDRVVTASGASVQNKQYTSGTDITTADIVVPIGETSLWLYFSSTGGQVTRDIRLIRPGYPSGTTQTFTDEFLNSIEQFKIIRLMDYMETNYFDEISGNGATACDTAVRVSAFGPDGKLDWSERSKNTDAVPKGEDGGSIEYMVELANTVDKDLWINIPHTASQDYIQNLADYLKGNLEPERKIYLEYSNEVWNAAFCQLNATVDEALAYTASGQQPPLVIYDAGIENVYYQARRLTAKKLVDISITFRQVFGNEAMMTRVRPVFGDQFGWFEQMSNVMYWVYRSYPDPPNHYIYAIAGAPYYYPTSGFSTTDSAFTGNGNVYDTINGRVNLDLSTSDGQYADYYTIAQAYGVKLMAYEGGIDTGQGVVPTLPNKIATSYDSRMENVTAGYFRTFIACGGGAPMVYFNAVSSFTQYGQWGLSDDALRDYLNPNNGKNPKWKGSEKIISEDPRTFECAPLNPSTGFFASTSGGILGDGTGLTGKYYSGNSFNDLKATRTDPIINFVWSTFATGAPAPEISNPEYPTGLFATPFSAKWTGKIMPKFSENYTFTLEMESGDTGVLRVNGQNLGSGGSIALTAGQMYDISIDYQPNNNQGMVRLMWESSSQRKALVPASQLFPI